MEYRIYLDHFPQVNLIGHSVCGKGWSIPDRKMPDTELIVVYSGVLCCEIEGRKHLLREGDACLTPPDTLMSQSAYDGPCRFFYVHFDVDYEETGKEAPGSETTTAGTAQDFYYLPPMGPEECRLTLQERMGTGKSRDEVFTLFEKALLERSQTGGGRLLMISLYLSQILVLLSRTGENRASRLSGERQQKKVVQDALVYLHANYARPVNIAELSSRLSVSQQYLGRLFKASVGVSPVRYVNRLRVEQAKTLMRTTAKNISEISFEVGFENIYYFSRTFKQYEGVSPAKYRSWLNSKSNE